MNTLRSPGRLEISIHINHSGIRASQRCKLIIGIYIRVYLDYDALDTDGWRSRPREAANKKRHLMNKEQAPALAKEINKFAPPTKLSLSVDLI